MRPWDGGLRRVILLPKASARNSRPAGSVWRVAEGDFVAEVGSSMDWPSPGLPIVGSGACWCDDGGRAASELEPVALDGDVVIGLEVVAVGCVTKIGGGYPCPSGAGIGA